MENQIQTLLTQVAPRSLFQILEIYTQAWTNNISTPLIGFSLQNGQELMGELVHIDFPTERLVLRQLGDSNTLHTTFLDFRYIQYFTLYGLEQHQAFVHLLS